MASGSKQLSEWINRAADEVYDYASDPANMPEWAPGLGSSIEQVDGQWFVDTPTGRVGVTFTPRNIYGVLDHDVTLPSPWPWCWRRGSGTRRGTACGRSPGPPSAAAGRAVGLSSEGRGESCRPATARPPGDRSCS
jgi:hypothetical protein